MGSTSHPNGMDVYLEVGELVYFNNENLPINEKNNLLLTNPQQNNNKSD